MRLSIEIAGDQVTGGEKTLFHRSRSFLFALFFSSSLTARERERERERASSSLSYRVRRLRTMKVDGHVVRLRAFTHSREGRRFSEKFRGYSRNRHRARADGHMIDKTKRAAWLGTGTYRYRPPNFTRTLGLVNACRLFDQEGVVVVVSLSCRSRRALSTRCATTIYGEWQGIANGANGQSRGTKSPRGRIIYEIHTRKVRYMNAVVSLETGRACKSSSAERERERERKRGCTTFYRRRNVEESRAAGPDNKSISTYCS